MVRSGVTSVVWSGVTSAVRSGVTSVVRSGVTSVVWSGVTSVVRSGVTSVVRSGVTSAVRSGVTSVVRSGVTSVVRSVSILASAVTESCWTNSSAGEQLKMNTNKPWLRAHSNQVQYIKDRMIFMVHRCCNCTDQCQMCSHSITNSQLTTTDFCPILKT